MDAVGNRIKLRHIACFVETARRGGVVQAAAALNLTQPGVSRTIRELEEIVGAQLFDRGGRSLQLNAAGRRFMTYAENAMSSLTEGVRLVGRGDPEGPVRIGALPTAAAQILPPAVAALQRSGALPRLRIATAPHAQLVAWLRAGELDLVLGRMAEPRDIAGLSFEYLYEEQLAVVVRPGHPLLSRPVAGLRETTGHPWLIPPPDAAIRGAAERFVASFGMTLPETAIETVSDNFARNYVRDTDALWLISRGVVERDIGDGLLAALPLPLEHTSGPVGLTLRTDASPPPPVRLLIETIRQTSVDR